MKCIHTHTYKGTSSPIRAHAHKHAKTTLNALMQMWRTRENSYSAMARGFPQVRWSCMLRDQCHGTGNFPIQFNKSPDQSPPVAAARREQLPLSGPGQVAAGCGDGDSTCAAPLPGMKEVYTQTILRVIQNQKRDRDTLCAPSSPAAPRIQSLRAEESAEEMDAFQAARATAWCGKPLVAMEGTYKWRSGGTERAVGEGRGGGVGHQWEKQRNRSI